MLNSFNCAVFFFMTQTLARVNITSSLHSLFLSNGVDKKEWIKSSGIKSYSGILHALLIKWRYI